MNLLKIISTMILLVILISSCQNELLETIPNDRLAVDLYWKTDKDAELATNAIYTYLEGIDIFSWDGMSDIGHSNQTFNNEAMIESGQYDALNSKVLQEWTNDYAGIRAANSFFSNVDKIDAASPDLIARLKGEVKVLRAYMYIRLAFLYGDVPLITSEISLKESRSLTRTQVSMIWDFVGSELTESATLLPVTPTEKGRITKGAALALKARVMLYIGKYEEAATAARQVIDMNIYSLYPSYEKLFSYGAENNKEVILDKQFIKSIYSNSMFANMAPHSQRASSNLLVPTNKLVDAYQMNNGKNIEDPTSGFDPQNPYANRDPRLKYSVYVLGSLLPDGKVFNSKPQSGTADAVDYDYISTKTGFTLKKYINSEDLTEPTNCGINIILIRYAEVLLTYAEAKIELNKIDNTVVDAINEVRHRDDVNMPPVSILSQSEMRNIVRKERLVELAFEGFRYFDIRRWRIAENVMPGKIYGMTYSDNGILKTIEVPAVERVFRPGRDYLWPIPQKEKELNPALGQNPNW
ncbi:outer membrane protein [Aquipluma nitroreducens]|uniref:Outer membrane protein n=1 Tax=Aquipluma nitroreducens TaxID=2010828 RepID=A0A5K7S4B1_9BACT|nr:RagB/SusD family nutrient uptake outer membrane protein [Aquipluma nitroreducens]BBE16337.1 outer membrane protein [Aquipluma nitroreducens]